MAQILLLMPAANRFDKVSTRVPNGLLAIAAPLVRAGYSVQIIDLKTVDNWLAALKKGIDHHTVCVGITCSTGKMITSALRIAQAVREIKPDLPLVWGGPHPTLLPEQTLAHPLVDLIVVNEGDLSFPELVDCLAQGKAFTGVQGIGYKVAGRPVLSPARPLVEDLDTLAPLPYELLDLSRYSALNVDGSPSLDVLTSRGCPFNCGFCSTPFTSQRRWRPATVENVVGQVRRLYNEHGVRTFYFVDDNFMVDLNRVERILERLKGEGLRIHWGTQGVRVDTVNRMSDQFLDLLENSGCKELSIGVETGNPDIMRLIDKRIRVEDVLAANEKLRGRDIAIKYNMIIGFPGETLAQVQNTVGLALKLAERNPKAWFPFNIYTPFPATPMFHKAVEHGFTPPESLPDWAQLESVGWERRLNHWLSPQENTLLRSINLTSYLAFPSARQKFNNPLLRLLFDLYRPLAHLRFKHRAYGLHLERWIVEALESRKLS
ncbi:MAG: B12-binding domain-containing radical SAM protein [Proteobacteria bacterium]|nr:B12-binding domain-containing radical SAM protein [Pseudomonadota bacterium]MBU1593910.1 B12-binding domain-containing radical SAM protein [Pseudomonadota bacterium]